ncbi:MAG: monofunctional biosynthetic peptidoglycan transglycosylase [Desulfobacterales bacterium]|nr:monofunctional biosynthetic peptidoglycan transglycosylase [Desulfobacterales bacterium]
MPGKKNKSIFRRPLRWGLRVIFFLLIFSFIQVIALRFINPPFTASMAWDRIKNRGAVRPVGLRNQWQELSEISPHLRRAVLAGEDQRFLSHYGFDLIEMNDAIKDTLLKNNQRGASTITMQVARTIFLWPDRSWGRKIAEAYYTVLIEVFWSKKRILEIYLNTVDWGSRTRGAEAASKKYFNVTSARISRSQASFLAAILPSPHTWSPTKPNARVLRRQKKILKDMDKMPLGFGKK